jgi:selenide,water dikinase
MKRLVLLGGGHAHVGVLADLAAQPLPGWEVHLVSPYRRQIYSGMLPGWIAGHYPIESCAIALDSMAASASVSFHETTGIALDPIRNELRCANGTTLRFDQLSIDTGPMPAIDALPGCVQHAMPIRPIEEFIAQWPDLAGRIRAARGRFDLAIVGGGAAGVELAFAIQHHASLQQWSQLRMTLVGTETLPMQGMPERLRQRAMKLLERRGILWHGRRRAVRIDAGAVAFENGAPLLFNDCLVVTGAAAPAWARSSGLATDEGGFIRVGPTLQSVSHPHIFAAGDVASYHDARPKSGVYAVKAGPILARNLRARCEGSEPENWLPQTRALYLISTGRRHALGVRGLWTFGGSWVWYWKDWIDRRFMRRFGVNA